MLKTISSITNALGALNYKGTWNASTNTPTLASSVGAKGDYYVVSVAGTTNLNGEALWGVGDWATFNGSVWQRVEGGDTINATSVTTPIVQATNSGGLALKNSSGTTQLSLGAGGGDNITLSVATNITPANAAVAISPTGTGTLTLDPAAASTINNMSIGATTAATGRFTDITATTGNLVFETTAKGLNTASSIPLTFNINNSEAFRIDTTKSLCVGDTGNFGAKMNLVFDPASTNGLLFAVASGTFTNNYIYFQNSSGSKIGSVSSDNSSVTYNTTSDYRIKTNVQPITGALAKVAQLNPVTYDWTPDFAEGSSQGFIAHELQAVVPECVTGEKDAIETYTDKNGNEQTRPKYQGVDTSFLVATLTAAIKELKAEFDAYKASHP